MQDNCKKREDVADVFILLLNNARGTNIVGQPDICIYSTDIMTLMT